MGPFWNVYELGHWSKGKALRTLLKEWLDSGALNTDDLYNEGFWTLVLTYFNTRAFNPLAIWPLRCYEHLVCLPPLHLSTGGLNTGMVHHLQTWTLGQKLNLHHWYIWAPISRKVICLLSTYKSEAQRAFNYGNEWHSAVLFTILLQLSLPHLYTGHRRLQPIVVPPRIKADFYFRPGYMRPGGGNATAQVVIATSHYTFSFFLSGSSPNPLWRLGTYEAPLWCHGGTGRLFTHSCAL